ncbi:MAG: hypothetical protein RBT34_00410 [Anaerolineaceae bacterium]|jgi:hypothetical protein|nr:hypothetical protein [Anaerolineaceae bacterium]
MSGHKLSTLSIRKFAAARLTKQRIRAILLEEENQNRSARLREEHIEDMNRVFQGMEDRQSRFDHTLDGFQSRTLQRLEQENNAAWEKSQAALAENMHSLFNRMWLETDEAFTGEMEEQGRALENLHDLQADILYNEEVNRENSERLAVQFNQHQQHVTHVFLDFQSRQAEISDHQQVLFEQVQTFIQQQEQLGRFQDSKEEIVTKQLNDAEMMYDFITANFDHEKFTGGAAQRAAFQLEQAHQNLDQGFLDAALVKAQQAYQSLSEQRFTLQHKQAEWDLLHLEVKKNLHQLLAAAEELQEIPSTDLDGNEIGQMIDVDYWSARRLSRLKTMIHTRLGQIETRADALQTDELLAIQQDELPRMFEELENTCRLAIEEALNSQLRVNIADIVIQALENQGFCFSESSYQHNDLRKAYSANVTNLAGDEIIIGVEPNKGEPGSSNLHIISADAEQRSEHELQQRAKEVFATLNQYGLEHGSIHILPKPQQETNPQQTHTERKERKQSHRI